jgi:ferrous iron transport protein B
MHLMSQIVALAGNPNAGKTSLFNNLTGARQYVGNWAGVTVEKKEGWIRSLPELRLVDLPGIYSLSAQSIEEKLAVHYLVTETPDVLLNIVDVSNLERNLYLSVQILEMGIPTVMALNMMDVAESRGISINIPKLEESLGIPLVPIVARKQIGQELLLKRLQGNTSPSSIQIPYPQEIERAIEKLVPLLKRSGYPYRPNLRWIALMWLEQNEAVCEILQETLDLQTVSEMQEIRNHCPSDVDQQIRNARYTWIEEVIRETVSIGQAVEVTWSDRIDRILLHRYLGIPIFLLIMFMIFQITYSWFGSALSDQLDTLLNEKLTGWVQAGLNTLGGPEWFQHLLTDGAIAGVSAVLVFIPQITTLFLCLSFLEDSGYMARAAILMDRFMRSLGLNGKAFIPLILGFGCNVPAIMAARTLDDPKSRLVTILIAPFMSCSARLTVYSLFVATFFAKWQAEIVFLLYIMGILMAVVTALLLKKQLQTDESLFVMELPPYRAPMLKNLLLHTWEKSKGFIRKAGTIIFGMSVLLWLLGNLSFHGVVSMEDSFLAAIGGVLAPVFAPMGYATWQAGVALLTGFMAKEVVISTMGIIYGVGNGTDGLGHILQQSFSSASALSFLFFVLLYTPCLSTVVMMKRETGSWRWTLYSVLYSLLVAWLMAFLVYRIAILF